MTSESAEIRHLRLAAIAVGLGSIIFSLLGVPDIIRDAANQVPAFTWASVILFCGLPVLTAALAQWGGVRATRTVARAHTIATALIVVLWSPFEYTRIAERTGPWIFGTIVIAAGTAVIAWRGRVVWAYIVGISLGCVVVRAIELDGRRVVTPLEDGIDILTVSVVIALLLSITIRLGREQDDAVAVAILDARGAAEADSRARQRSRFASLIHDDVITTLLAAAQATRRVPAIEQSASRALARLEGFVSVQSDDSPLDPGMLQIELRAAVTEVVDGVEFVGTFDGFRLSTPGSAALALTGALAEAARNSVRHAGAVVHRRVDMSADDDTVVVEFSDDGLGFDIARVAGGRFGIRSSIHDRMLQVGGRAEVVSAPGAGTRVRLIWPETAPEQEPRP